MNSVHQQIWNKTKNVNNICLYYLVKIDMEKQLVIVEEEYEASEISVLGELGWGVFWI